MPARLAVAVVALALATVPVGCGGGPGERAGAGSGPVGGELRVAAAASLTEPFTALGRRFERAHPDVHLRFDFGPSSGLAQSLEEGAPADVFASADERIMDRVVDSGLVDRDEPVIFARNRLAIAVPVGNPGSVRGLDDLARPELLVGLCAADVPCGRLARALLRRAGVTPAVDTEELDAKALLSRITAGELDAGIVYHSDVVAAGDRVTAVAVPRGAPVATYPVAVLAGSAHPAAAAAFVTFVSSSTARPVLRRAGFLLP